MARQKYDPALFLSCEPQQGIGQVLFAERLNLLAAVTVANDNFTTAGDTEFTYPFRCQVRVDELQCDVILEALVSADQVSDLTMRELIFTNIRPAYAFSQQLVCALYCILVFWVR